VSKLSASQIYTLLLQGGFSPDQAHTMTAIAQAESARDPGAIGDVRLENHTWGPSVGLFQIRTLKSETGTGSDRDIEHLMGHPEAQVEAALHISNHGRNYRPWSTFTSGSYRQFLDEPLHDGASLDGIDTGSGTSSTLADQAGVTDPAAGADPFGIDKGVAPAAVTDHDGDGLTDQFEALLGTNPNEADSDHDGLSDTYETTISHTDPLSADTDHDGVTDGVEVSQGTDPGHVDLPAAARAAGFGGLDTLDSDHDGLSDGFEQRIGTDPFSSDTDHDGLNDGLEVAQGSDPHSADSNHDGLTDGFAAEHDLLVDDPAGADPGH
jgi:Lysozyme like domain/Bacterial TSP3 repeat